MSMFAALQRRHWLLQVVLATLLLAAFSPTLSRALAHGRGQFTPWAEVCATLATGVADAATADAGDLNHALEHCPLCALQTDLPAVLPASLSALPAVLLFMVLPPLRWQAPAAPQAWQAAQPRAPPPAF